MCVQLVTVHRAILYQLCSLGVGLEAVRVQEQTLGESVELASNFDLRLWGFPELQFACL